MKKKEIENNFQEGDFYKLKIMIWRTMNILN